MSCGLGFFGFNAAGTKLYDDVNCGFHGGSGHTYYEHTVNLQTGALGPDVKISARNDYNGASNRFTFVGNLLVDFQIPNDWQQGVSSVNIYPLVPNTSKRLLQCTAKMLEAYGYAEGAVVHPSGKYVFMTIAQDSVQIDKLELGQKKIVDTGNYIPYQFSQFSPDGSLIYGIYNSSTGYYIEIFGFNVATSTVTTGGYVISVPSALDPYFVAQRY